MQIFVRHGLGQAEECPKIDQEEHVQGFQSICQSDTVDSLMGVLSRTWPRPIPKSARLVYNGRCLLDGGRTLREYGIGDCSMIQLECCSLKGGMMIKVKTLTGKEIEIDIEPSDTVERIKERVEEKEGIPPVQQRYVVVLLFHQASINVWIVSRDVYNCRLIFAGKQMNDDKMAKEYHVEGGSVLHLVLALRGGR